MDEPASLDFPLDVYARCLLLDRGETGYVYIGLFERPDEMASGARPHCPQLLRDRLAPPPASILDIGPGHGRVRAVLQHLGYEVLGCSPGEAGRDIGYGSAAGEEGAWASQLDGLHRHGGTGLARILLRESVCRLDILDVFSRAFDLLDDNGDLILLDELAARPQERAGAESPPLSDVLVAQAERNGLTLIESRDLSALAAATSRYLAGRISAYRQGLMADLVVQSGEIQRLRDRLQGLEQRSRAGACRYLMLRFRKGARPRWRIATSRAADRPAVRALFHQVFAPQRMSRELWEWKYGGGRGMAVLAWQGDRLVAHYGGMVRPIQYFGRVEMGVQIGDVMVAKDQRGVLTRHGAFYRVAATFLERWIGFGSPCLLGFGFPTVSAMNLAERVGLYAQVGKILEMRWSALAIRPRLLSRIRHLRRNRDGAEVDALWRRMSTDLRGAIVGVRDWDYVQRRYLGRPEKAYEILLITRRPGAAPLGLVVLHPGEDGTDRLLDIIGPLRYLPTCLLQARRAVARRGARQLSAWISDGFADLFAATGATSCPTDVRIPTSVHTPGPHPDRLRGRWWLTGGDTDFN